MSNQKNRKAARILALIVAVAMLIMTFFYVFAMTGWFGSAMQENGFIVNAASNSDLDISLGETSDTVVLSDSSYETLYGATFYYGQTPLKYRVDALEELVLEIQGMYKDEVSLDTLFSGVYQGLFESLDDPWSVYYPSQETANQIIKSIEGEYGGVGITMTMDEEKVLVTATVVDSPAYKAGIKSGDFIVKVDTTDVGGMSIEDVALLIRGESGTNVTLTVDRNGTQMLFTMNRQIIKTTSVSNKMMDNNIGYIKISSFDSNTGEEFKVAHLTLLNQGMNGMIIDIRDNSGGLMSSALDIADQLIPTDGYIAYYERQGEIIETVKSTIDSTKVVPTVILINGNTASASECLVGALKDRGIATIIGENTYGKGVAQIISSAGDNAALKLSVFYFLTPNKSRIDHNGIAPNIVVNSNGNLTKEELANINKTLAPMTESVKYFAGNVGLNVYAAQQRLQYLGYALDLTAIMDDKTVIAIKEFQQKQLLCPYGGLDFTTIKALANAFDAYINPSAEDLQLAKAVEVITR